MTAGSRPPLEGVELTEGISAALVGLYGKFYGHDRTTATTYINDNVVVCILEDILSEGESDQVAKGDSGDVIDGRVAFQVGAEDEFTAAIERLTGRAVTAFLSANQTDPGIASELFFLEAPPEGTA
ncbi:MAG: Na-translocating system protein MpsC family protein [Solirubrobacterales bacterium]